MLYSVGSLILHFKCFIGWCSVDSGIAPEHSGTRNNLPRESNNDEIAEDMHSLPDNGLPTPFNKDIAEDNQICVL